MASTFESFIQSPQFTFFVGQEGKPIVVHAAAIAATSHQLDALINSGMQESKARCAKIEDVRIDDFIRFCEYAYRGDYAVPPWEELPPGLSFTPGKNQQSEDDSCEGWTQLSKKQKDMKMKKMKKKAKQAGTALSWDESPAAPEPAPPEPAPPEPAPPEPPSPELSPPETPFVEDYPKEVEVYQEPAAPPAFKSPYVARNLSRIPLRSQFNRRNYINDGGPKKLILQHFEPKSNSAADQNFTPVFLAHARLYSFAHLRLIMPLKELTLHKLHKTLMNFKLYTKRVGDIIELAKYAYSNPDLPDRKDDGTIDDLRKLVVEYIVCEMDTIGNCDEFVRYMEEGGEFVGDFWRMARNYIA